MNRTTMAVDRILGIMVALALIAAGVYAIVWWSGRGPSLAQGVDLSGLAPMTHEPWWAWALGTAGIAAVLLGLRWLLAHLPDRGVSHLSLDGSSREGRLMVEAGAVAAAAAQSLESTPGVRSSRGSIHRDRGQIVAVLRATIERGADLHVVSAAADRASADLAQVLQRDDMRCSVQLRAVGRARSLPRVH